MRILIVDDHPLTREALTGLLAHNGFDVCGQAAGGEEAIRLAGELQPDLVLLDLTMPGLDGLHALPRIRKASPSSSVVVLTAAEDEDNLLAAIRAGAAGYLLKSEPPERIVSLLRGIGEGEPALSGPVARRLLEQVQKASASGRAFRRRSATASPPARWRCCCCSSVTWRRTRSPRSSGSRSTPCART